VRILVVIPTLGYGGAERLLVTLLPRLKEIGYDIKVCIFSTPDDLKDELLKCDIEVVNLKLSHRWSFLEALLKLHKEIKAFKADILWGHLYFGILYSRLVSCFFKKIKIITLLHDSLKEDYKNIGLWYKFTTLIYKKTQFLDTYTVAVSKSVKNEYENVFRWKNIKLIFNAIDLNKINSAINDLTKLDLIQKFFLINEKDIIITLPGRLDKRKGHRFLLDSINQLPLIIRNKMKILFIGDGLLKDELLKYSKEKKIDDKVFFLGNLIQSELFQLMAISDIIIIPSLTEPFGIVAIEAMYIEKPIIVTNIDGLKEITNDGVDAIQIMPKNANAISIAILKLLKDKNFKIQLAKNAKKTAMQYDVNHIVNRWVELFEREMR
jgi:glycosyltransferase involved in cell wall biosynthesis